MPEHLHAERDQPGGLQALQELRVGMPQRPAPLRHRRARVHRHELKARWVQREHALQEQPLAGAKRPGYDKRRRAGLKVVPQLRREGVTEREGREHRVVVDDRGDVRDAEVVCRLGRGRGGGRGVGGAVWVGRCRAVRPLLGTRGDLRRVTCLLHAQQQWYVAWVHRSVSSAGVVSVSAWVRCSMLKGVCLQPNTSSHP